MEDAILSSEEKAAELEALINDPDFHANRFAELPATLAKLEAAKAETARLYARWEELEALPK
jgi:ATP-binding cassette subfamily F protein uup